MTRALFALLTAGLAATTLPARPDDATEARALVERAIKAHGGAEAVGKFKASVVGFKGTFHGMGEEIPMTGEVSTFGAENLKADVEVEAGGQKFRVVNVVAGDKGWNKIAADTKEMGKDEVAEAREQQHAGWVASLAPLVGGGAGYALAPAGELLVNDKAALGVKVSAKGRRDVTLYFDKATGLLARFDATVKDEGSGREVAQETVTVGYTDVQGTRQSAKFRVTRDGKLYLEGEATSHQLSESLDPGVFARP